MSAIELMLEALREARALLKELHLDTGATDEKLGKAIVAGEAELRRGPDAWQERQALNVNGLDKPHAVYEPVFDLKELELNRLNSAITHLTAENAVLLKLVEKINGYKSIAALESDIEKGSALRADAERYRYIRTGEVFIEPMTHDNGVKEFYAAVGELPGKYYVDMRDFDMDVDAEIAGEKK